jgi:DNA-binding NtrC family response regulator
MLEAYDWPGNIRQLENAIFRASVLCEGDVLTEEEFPQIRAQVEGAIDLDRAADAIQPVPADEISASAPARAFGILRGLDERGNVRTLADVELEMIKLAIEHYQGQMSEVARRLGIGRSTLYRKLKEYGIDPDTGRLDRLAS